MRFTYFKKLLMFSLTLSVASAFSAPTDLDTSFGVAGRTSLTMSESASPLIRMALQADGKILLAGTVSITGFGSPTRLFVRRLNADGSTDLNYGVAGETSFSVQGGDTITAITLQADGKALLAISARTPCNGVAPNTCVTAANELTTLASVVARINQQGMLDTAFGNAGFATARTFYGPTAVSVQKDGKILLLGTASIARIQSYNWRLARFNADGSLDVSFNGGTVNSLCASYGSVMYLRDDGGIVVAGGIDSFGASADDPGICIEARLADGSPDTAVPPRWVKFDGNVSAGHLQATEDNRLLLSGGIRVPYFGQFATGYFLHYLAMSGAPGATGINSLTFHDSADSYAYRGTMIERYGATVSIGQGKHVIGQTQITPIWDRLTPFGSLSDFSISSAALDGDWIDSSIRQPDGKWLLAFSGPQRYGVARYLGMGVKPASVAAAEFFNTGLNHYFITAVPAESAAIEAGAAGPGWVRTGKTLRVFTPQNGVDAGARPVCRFYGTRGLGPNSHFYTVNEDECAAVKLDPGWTFEGVAFYAFLPVANGCVSGTVPVYRMYNQRFAQNDSNHRYATNLALLEPLLAQGWKFEGIAFCTPQD
ncbi:hypothetical protein BH11PSE11_BH11PSE11_10640 [soil metagenome]